AVPPVDLSAPRLARVGPEVEAALADATEDRVELALADEERVVLRRDLVVGRMEVERHVVVDADDVEGPEARGRRPAEDFGEERRRASLVATPDDRVVQPYAHAGRVYRPGTLSPRAAPRPASRSSP